MERNSKKALELMNEYKPLSWEMIPDIGLYMDQVITLITRIYEPLYGSASEGYLSPSMINNYVKAKLIPRPLGKKYNREQIALLLMIVSLKQVSTMEDIRVMLSAAEQLGVQALYTRFCDRQRQVLDALITDQDNQNSALPPAMNFAIVSSGYRAGCEAMLKLEGKE